MRNTISVLLLGLFFCLSTLINAADKGGQAPNVALAELNGAEAGETVNLADYQGKLVYLDFWASWCGPCRQSLPALNELRNTLENTDFEVVAINVDENLDDALDFLEKHPVDYPILLDPEGNSPGLFEIPGMPTAYLISPEGEILHTHVGFRKGDAEKLEVLVNYYLTEL